MIGVVQKLCTNITEAFNRRGKVDTLTNILWVSAFLCNFCFFLIPKLSDFYFLMIHHWFVCTDLALFYYLVDYQLLIYLTNVYLALTRVPNTKLGDILAVINKTKQIAHEPHDGGGLGIKNTKAQTRISTHNSYYSNYSLLWMSGI